MYFIIQACLFAVVGPSPLQLRRCVGIYSVCECSFFPLLSSQWHWEQNELLHCWRQAQDKNNRAPGKRTQQQGRPASSSSFSSLRPLSFLCYYGHLSSCFSVSFPLSSLIVRPLTGWKLCTPIAMRRKTKWHFSIQHQTPFLWLCFCAPGYFGDTVCWAFLSLVCLAFSWFSTRRGALWGCGPNKRVLSIKSLYK